MDDDQILEQEPVTEPDGAEPDAPSAGQEPDASATVPDAPPVDDHDATIRRLQSEKDRARWEAESAQKELERVRAERNQPPPAPAQPAKTLTEEMRSVSEYDAIYNGLVQKLNDGDMTRDEAALEWSREQRIYKAEKRAERAEQIAEKFDAIGVADIRIREALGAAQIEDGETEAVLGMLAEIGIDTKNPSVSGVPADVLAKLTTHFRNSVRYLNSNNGSGNVSARSPQKPAINLMAPGAPATPSKGRAPVTIRDLTEKLKRESGLT